MKTNRNLISKLAISVFAMLLLAVVPAVALAQRGARDPQLERRVRKELVTLPYYGVFDNLAYKVDGGTVIFTVKWCDLRRVRTPQAE